MTETQKQTSLHGTVGWFSNYRGYGFIKPDDGGEDVFVHHTGINATGYRELIEGQRVTFQVVSGSGGRPMAIGVRVLDV